MIVLGIIDSKPSAAAIMVDGQIVAAISEERICRMKMAGGMPRQAIWAVMKQAGVSPRDLNSVAVAQRVSVFEPEPVPWYGWFEEDERRKPRRFEFLSGVLAPIAGRSPLARKVHHGLKGAISHNRLDKIRRFLRDEHDIAAPVRFYDHHYCHATSTYYTSGFERALVITLDGGGDGRSGSVYVGENGRLTPVSSVDSFNSLGNFYSYITHLCGFKAELHEGKVTGLAALGAPVYAELLRQFVDYRSPGQIAYGVPMYHRSALREISKRLPKSFDRADLASSAQTVLEDVATDFARYWLKQTGLKNLAVAGGVFANVKLNQRLHELPEVENFFVHPAMDDSGLSVGSALAVLAESAEPASGLIRRLPDVYLGAGLTDSDIEDALRRANCRATHHANIHETIAELLGRGYIVARFNGRMEYGPRALGHRSILYQTSDPSVNDWLNERLERTEFMPFAPATLDRYASDCYENLEGALDPARFMTITFMCTPRMKADSPGVVHVDGTARPQILDPDTAPDFYGILSAYHRLTGIPSLINTSFNMHGEPIVCTPDDAIRCFRQGKLDFLAIGNWLAPNPEAIALREHLSTFDGRRMQETPVSL